MLKVRQSEKKDLWKREGWVGHVREESEREEERKSENNIIIYIEAVWIILWARE
jgi:hypothetical protein